MRRKTWRYLRIQLINSDDVASQSFLEALNESFMTLYGKTGFSEANPRLIEFNEEKASAVVKCSHSSLDKLRVAVLMMKEISGKPVAAYVKHVSGTLKSLKR